MFRSAFVFFITFIVSVSADHKCDGSCPTKDTGLGTGGVLAIAIPFGVCFLAVVLVCILGMCSIAKDRDSSGSSSSNRKDKIRSSPKISFGGGYGGGFGGGCDGGGCGC